MTARKFIRGVLLPRQSGWAWVREVVGYVAFVAAAAFAFALLMAAAGCATPPAQIEELSCLGEALAASGGTESLIAEFGDCDAEFEQVATR